MEMNHTSYDLEKQHEPIPIVEEMKQRTLPDLDKLKIDLSKSIENQEQEVYRLVTEVTLKENIEKYAKWKIEIKHIKEGVFSLKSLRTWNVNYFVNQNWEIIFTIPNIKERPFVENGKAFELAWYTERKENWLFNMYRLEWNKEIWPIDINSPEYYQAWLDIIFYADILNKFVSLKFNDPETKKWIEVLIDWWSFKYEDLELFLDRWLITREIFDYWIEEMKKVIVNQCSDKRLIKLIWLDWESEWIKESDLKKYMDAGYIDSSLAMKCYDVLPEKMKDLSN